MDKRGYDPTDLFAEPPNGLENIAIGLDEISSFEDMFTLIKGQHEIREENGRLSSPAEIIEQIEAVIREEKRPATLTRTYGIRKNVIKLLSAKKRVLKNKKK